MLHNYVILSLLFLQLLFGKSTLIYIYVTLCFLGFKVKNRFVELPFQLEILLLLNKNNNIWWGRAGNDTEQIPWFCFHWWWKTLNEACWLLLTQLQEQPRLFPYLNICSLTFLFFSSQEFHVISPCNNTSTFRQEASFIFLLCNLSESVVLELLSFLQIISCPYFISPFLRVSSTSAILRIFKYTASLKINTKSLLFFLLLSLNQNRVLPITIHSATVLPAPRLCISECLCHWPR